MQEENTKNKIQKIYLASDHAGFELKEIVKNYLLEKYVKYEVVDFGACEYDELDNYTDFIHKAGKELSKNKQDISFVFGGSGEGEAMVMNRYARVRCTTYYGYDLNIIEIGRKHNDANAISFGARFLEKEECFKAIDIFIKTDFEKGRHEKRVKEIEIEK